MTFESYEKTVAEVNLKQIKEENNSEDMPNSVSVLRLPWRFTDAQTEHTYNEKRGKALHLINFPF
jgi:hypothetical protein